MARLRMEVEGTERVAELMEQVTQKALELQEAADKLRIAAVSLRLSGTLEGTEDAQEQESERVKGLTVEIPSET